MKGSEVNERVKEKIIGEINEKMKWKIKEQIEGEIEEDLG